MLNCLQHLKGSFPTVHLIAVSASVFILGLTLFLLPSEEVSATRSHPVSTTTESPEQTPQPPAVLLETKVDLTKIADSLPEDTDNWVEYKVKSGDTLSSLFSQAGLTPRDVYRVTYASKNSRAFRKIFPGQTIAFVIEDGQLIKLKHIESQLKSTLLTRTNNGYDIQLLEREPETKHHYAAGTIENSLFLAGEEAGLSNRKIMELASLFGWDVDFVLDIREGDSFNLIYEQRYLDGKVIGEGNIIAAQFINQGSKYTAIRYTDANGDSSYYSPEGYSMRKAFLRSPVDFARISSRFNPRRKHPVLNRIRAHKGVDYAASTGTPIKAAGDGKIIFRGKKGGFGNVVILQHGSNITTLYAHMNYFKRGQRNGHKVKQGDVIGFVGKTGLASGPHLHYEFRVNGVHKNPLTVKLPTAAPIANAERSTFKTVASSLLAQLETFQATQLAAADLK